MTVDDGETRPEKRVEEWKQVKRWRRPALAASKPELQLSCATGEPHSVFVFQPSRLYEETNKERTMYNQKVDARVEKIHSWKISNNGTEIVSNVNRS